MSSTPSVRPATEEEPEPQGIRGEDWEKLSPEAKIQWTTGDEKWGWVVYRCSYAKELEPAWENLKRGIVENLRQHIVKSDTPGIADKMDFVFIEDPGLEGASNEQLQLRFQAWARANPDYQHVEGSMSRGSRFQFFLKANVEALRDGHLGLVHGWPYDLDEDWIKILDDAVSPHLYIDLDNPEQWYMYYKPPEFGVANVY